MKTPAKITNGKKSIKKDENALPAQIAKMKIIRSGELFRQTWSDYRRSWQKFGLLLILPLVLSFISSLMIYCTASFIDKGFWQAWLIAGIAIFILMVCFAVLYLISYISQFLLLADLSQEVNFGNLKAWYKRSLPFFWPVMGISVVYTLFCIAGFIALIIPGIMFAVYYWFAVYASVFDGRKLECSFGRSRELVSGYWWAVFGRFVLGMLAIYAFYGLIILIGVIVAWVSNHFWGFKINNNLFNLLSNLLSIFINLIIGPLTLLYTYKIYQSLKEIKRSND